MASDEAIKKMIQAIMDKRKKLGMADWGLVPVEDVLSRLDQFESKNKSKESSKTHLENDQN